MLLVSILITSADGGLEELPQKVKENIDSFKRWHPNFEHRLFFDQMIREFLSARFGAETLEAYDSLKPYSYKADLARYCLIYYFGGIYADISTFFFTNWPPLMRGNRLPEQQIAVFKGSGAFAPWEIPQTVFYAPAQHKALAKAIDLVCANVKNRYYGSTPLCPTGPVLFGKAIASTCDPNEVILGECKTINPTGDLTKFISEPSTSFMFRNNLVATKRKRGGGPQTELGLKGGNSYLDAWNRRDIYS